MKKVVLIFGYNNTRIYDLFRIRKLAKERLGAETVLIKDGLTDEDRAAADYGFDHKSEDAGISKFLVEFLRARELAPMACLPFSDKGVLGAAQAARDLGLFGDDPANSEAMLDKRRFREMESLLDLDAKLYKKPFFKIVYSEVELFTHLTAVGPFFLKPIAEGNSRGCMKIETETDLEKWLTENRRRLKSGVIAEEIIGEKNELSFDGVDGAYWITQKFTTTGNYRAEYQQIVPAPLHLESRQSLHGLLTPLLKSLGSNGGAFHHEFFALPDGRIASVEPNRRPAGMWIWDLAAWAFEDFDPWARWIDRCAGVLSPAPTLKQKAFAGVRGVIAKEDGTLVSIRTEMIQRELTRRFGKDNIKVSLLKVEGASVRAEPRDNSDFLALLALRRDRYDELLDGLDEAEALTLRGMEFASCV